MSRRAGGVKDCKDMIAEKRAKMRLRREYRELLSRNLVPDAYELEFPQAIRNKR